MGDSRKYPYHTMGGKTLNFQRGKMVKASLEIADLMTSPVCKS